MSATTSTQWYWTDWLGDPAVRRLTVAERGVWIDLLALAAGGTPYGFVSDWRGDPLPLKELSSHTRVRTKDLRRMVEAIVAKGAASRDERLRMYSRRMVRENIQRLKKRGLEYSWAIPAGILEGGLDDFWSDPGIWKAQQKQGTFDFFGNGKFDPRRAPYLTKELKTPFFATAARVAAPVNNGPKGQEEGTTSAPPTAPPPGAAALAAEQEAKWLTDKDGKRWNVGGSIPISEHLINQEAERVARKRLQNGVRLVEATKEGSAS